MTNWKEEIDVIQKEDVLNELNYDDVSQIQQMLYLILKKIENLESRVANLE